MSEHFATGALRLAALAARALGWRPAEFWEATPAEIACILAPEASSDAPLCRAEFDQLMEQDNG